MSIEYTNLKLNKFLTSDKAKLYYYKRRSKCEKRGTVLIILGWNQIANGWSPVLNSNKLLKKYYDVWILVMRSFNKNEIVYGNSIARYARDVYEFIKCKNLKDVIYVGHSMGTSILWQMISLYGEKLFKGYGIIDQGPILLQNPTWNETQNKEFGAIFTPDQGPSGLFSVTDGIKQSQENADQIKDVFIRTMFTEKFKQEYPEIVTKTIQGAQNYYYFSSGEILYDHICKNWIDDILNKIIKKPALLIGGIVSIVPYQSIIYQTQYYKNKKVHIFTEEQGGSHNMFIENPQLFNQYLNDFLKYIN